MDKNQIKTDLIRTKLSRLYPANKEAIWLVRGEYRDVGMFDSGSMPILGYFSGQYIDIVDLALSMEDFFSVGAGGEIELIEVVEIKQDNTIRVQNATKELSELENRKKELLEILENSSNPYANQ